MIDKLFDECYSRCMNTKPTIEQRIALLDKQIADLAKSRHFWIEELVQIRKDKALPTQDQIEESPHAGITSPDDYAEPVVQAGWCPGCTPDNCPGCGPTSVAQQADPTMTRDELIAAAESIGMRFPAPVAQDDETKWTEVDLWAEIHRLRAEVAGPDGFATWKEAAVAERVRRVRAEGARVPLSTPKDRPGATFVEGYGFVDTNAVRAIERIHGVCDSSKNSKAIMAVVKLREEFDRIDRVCDEKAKGKFHP